MKNLIKVFIFATFALSFAACKNDKTTSETATTTTASTTTAEPSAVPISMATPEATVAAPSSGAAAASKPTVEPVKPVSAQTTPATPAAAAPSGKTTAVKFEETSYSWGSVNEGDKMTHIFKFKNTGTNDLIISDAHGSCGCTVPEWPKEPIKPGKGGVIKVVFDSKGKPGDQQKTVTMTANTDPANTVLTIKGAVKPAAQ